MLEKLKKSLEFSAKTGWYLPAAYDASRKEPSTTLLSFYIGLLLTVVSLTAYHFMPDKLTGPTSMTLLFLGMTFIFYRMRNLDKVKLDLDDREIELENSSMNDEKEEENG